MELKVNKESDTELVVEIDGLTHTIANLIKSKVLENKDVTYVSYNISHPLVPKPTITILTNGKIKPRDVFTEVLKSVIKEMKEFQEKYRAALAELMS